MYKRQKESCQMNKNQLKLSLIHIFIRALQVTTGTNADMEKDYEKLFTETKPEYLNETP